MTASPRRLPPLSPVLLALAGFACEAPPPPPPPAPPPPPLPDYLKRPRIPTPLPVAPPTPPATSDLVVAGRVEGAPAGTSTEVCIALFRCGEFVRPPQFAGAHPSTFGCAAVDDGGAFRVVRNSVSPHPLRACAWSVRAGRVVAFGAFPPDDQERLSVPPDAPTVYEGLSIALTPRDGTEIAVERREIAPRDPAVPQVRVLDTKWPAIGSVPGAPLHAPDAGGG